MTEVLFGAAMPPDHVEQTTPASTEEAKRWLNAKRGEFKLLHGCPYIRAHYDERHGVLLLEGWKVRPLRMPKPQLMTTQGEV